MPNAAQAGAVIFAKDLHRVATFYEKLLGLPAVHSESDHIVLASAQCELVIHAIPNSHRRHMRDRRATRAAHRNADQAARMGFRGYGQGVVRVVSQA